MSNYYDYQELRSAALTGNQKAIDALGRWFEQFGTDFWNGEFYEADGYKVYPVYKEIADDQFDLVGYRMD